MATYSDLKSTILSDELFRLLPTGLDPAESEGLDFARTAIGILAGAYGQATIAGELDRILETSFPALAAYTEIFSTALVVICITYVSLIVGELVPKRIGQLSGGRVIARSAGSTPAEHVHPHVRSLLAEIEGDKASQLFPKPLTDDAVRAADVVVTMGCGDVCPVIPGVRYEDWAVGDPALASPAGAAAIRDDIESRVRTLLDTLLTD